MAGTGSGTVPTLYNVGFTYSATCTCYLMNASANSAPAALANGIADSSDVTEFFNANDTTGGPDGTDYLFVGVTDGCFATTDGGDAEGVMSLDITSGSPTVGTGTPAIAATGGPTGIIVDNNSSVSGGLKRLLRDKKRGTLVQATQNGLH